MAETLLKSHLLYLSPFSLSVWVCVGAMDSGSQQEIRIIDKDESSDRGFHVIEGFVIEDSKTPFPVLSPLPYHTKLYLTLTLSLSSYTTPPSLPPLL